MLGYMIGFGATTNDVLGLINETPFSYRPPIIRDEMGKQVGSTYAFRTC